MARRLTKELGELQKCPLDYCTLGPVDDDIMHWNAMMVGPEESPYNGGVFNLDINFPKEYPFKAPKVKFLTRIYHPNVKSDTGEICADVINENWGPTLNVTYILNIIRQMLSEPHADQPVEADIARELSENRSKFNETAAKWTAQYAS